MSLEVRLATEVGVARRQRCQRQLQECQQVLDSDPFDRTQYYIQGMAQYVLGDLHSAIESFNQAILDPAAPALWFADLGIALVQAGKLVEAGIKFVAALARDPKCVKVHYGLGFMHAASGDYSTALNKYKVALEVDSDFIAASAGIGLIHLLQKKTTETGRKFLPLSQLEAASQQFEQVLEQDGSVPEALYGMGEIRRLRRELVQASNYYEAALMLNGSLTSAHYKLGKALASLGNVKKSVSHLRTAYWLNPHDDEIKAVLDYQLSQHYQDPTTPPPPIMSDS